MALPADAIPLNNTQQSSGLPSDAISLNNTQTDNPLASMDFSMSDNSSPTQQSTYNIKGLNAVALETGRGLEQGTGQLIADAGWISNGAGMFKNGIGTAINQYGKDMMANAQALPETDLPGVIKGAANIVGQAAPMLASFGAGEALGAVKIGELATNAVGTMTNMRAAKYFDVASRAMGQGTLFGVVNAIDIASIMPESSNMKDQINAIMDSGKAGFVAGATLTPLLEIGHQILSKYGEKALRAYTVGITGSEKAADRVYDESQIPGMYQSVMKVDPNAPEGQQITLQLSKTSDITPEAQRFQHEQMNAQLDNRLTGIKESHEQMKQNLSDEIAKQQEQFSVDQRIINSEVDAGISDIKLKKSEIINQDNTKALNDAVTSLQNGIIGNSHNLQTATQAFDGTIQSSLNLTNTAKEELYNSVIKTTPADGFNTQGLISKIKNMMQDEYGITLKKFGQQELTAKEAIAMANKSPSQRTAPARFNQGPWQATSRAAGGQINANAFKVTKYLTDTLLPDLEEKIKTNNGIYTVDMMRETTKNIKALGYEDGISNPGYASLDRIFRPNKNIGEILDKKGLINTSDKGLFIGSDTSLSAMKQAAMLDNKFSTIKSLSDEYASSIRPSVEIKAKAFGKDLQSVETLSKLEAAMDLPVDSNLRLSNNMQKYYDTNNALIDKNTKDSYLLGEKLRLKQNALNDEMNQLKFNRTEERIGAKSLEKEKYLSNRRTAINAKNQEVANNQAFREQYNKAIEKEKFDREAALNEVRAVGRGDTPLGRIQRAFVSGSGWGLLYGHFATSLPALGAATVLSPKAGIPIVRGILKSSRTGTLSKVNRGLQGISQQKLLRQLVIGNSIKRN